MLVENNLQAYTIQPNLLDVTKMLQEISNKIVKHINDKKNHNSRQIGVTLVYSSKRNKEQYRQI